MSSRITTNRTGMGRAGVRRVARGGLLLLLVAGVAELLLFVACVQSPVVNAYLSEPQPADDQPAGIWHRVFKAAPNPAFPGHDFRGYRNVGHQDQFDVVALGDSQTYGMGVWLCEAWPQQLEFLSGKSVYNMSYGGFSSVQALYLLDEALAFEPETIIYGFYAARCFSAYRDVYVRGLASRFRELERDPLDFLVERGVLDPPERVKDLVMAMDPSAARIADPASGAWDPVYEPVPTVEPIAPVEDLASFPRLLRLPEAVNRYRLHYSRATYRRVYQDLGHIPVPMPQTILGEPVPERKPIASVDMPLADFFNRHIDIQSVTATRKRMLGMDLRDVRVAEGFRINMHVLEEMAERCRERGVRFVVLWIPTKENTKYDWLATHYQRRPISERYHRLHAMESLLYHAAARFLTSVGVDLICGLQPLAESYDQNIMPYHFDRDGHPNAVGFRLFAETAHAALLGEDVLAEPSAPEDLDEWIRIGFPRQAEGQAHDQQVLVQAILREGTVPPTPVEIQPYSDALIAHVYDVTMVRRGTMELGQIQVLHWAVRDGTVVPAPWRVNSTESLLLEPLALHAELADTFTLDHTENGFDLPVYVCVAR